VPTFCKEIAMTGLDAQAPLSLSVYVDDLAQKPENAARSLRERRIRLVRGVFRVK